MSDDDETLRPNTLPDDITMPPARDKTAPSAPRLARGTDQPRRRRGADGRSQSGFGDPLDRYYCLRFATEIAPDFPIQHRSNTASLRVREVDRRSNALLLCDAAHHGEHQWPDGIELDPVSEVALQEFLRQ